MFLYSLFHLSHPHNPNIKNGDGNWRLQEKKNFYSRLLDHTISSSGNSESDLARNKIYKKDVKSKFRKFCKTFGFS